MDVINYIEDLISESVNEYLEQEQKYRVLKGLGQRNHDRIFRTVCDYTERWYFGNNGNSDNGTGEWRHPRNITGAYVFNFQHDLETVLDEFIDGILDNELVCIDDEEYQRIERERKEQERNRIANQQFRGYPGMDPEDNMWDDESFVTD